MKKFFALTVAVGVIAFLGYLTIRPYTLSIAAIMKNEKPYLKEWIEYHRLQGVEHFYLCDNDSTDDTESYIQPYIKKGLITYIKMSGTNQQLACYDKIVKDYGDKTKWLAIIDLDEFLVPIKAKNMQDFLKEFDDVAEVSLYWLNYGDSGTIKRSNGLVTEYFTSHGRFLNHTVKSIVRPKQVVDFNAFGSNHYVKVNGKSVNEHHEPVNYMLGFNISGDKARVNHYILKSFSEFLTKKRRGHPEGTSIDFSYYFFHNENDITEDTTMKRFLPDLKKAMQKSPLSDVDLPVVDNLPDSFDDYYFSAEEATSILNRPVKNPMSFNDVAKAYKNHYPEYK